jgi:hypothetical protein
MINNRCGWEGDFHVRERHPLDMIVVLKLESSVSWAGVASEEEDIYGLADGLKKD